MMRAVLVSVGASLLASASALGQTAGESLTFEVASVKRSGPASVSKVSGGPGTRDPGRYTATDTRLRYLLFDAYRTSGDEYDQQIRGPAWIDIERYDVIVKIPPGTTKEQFQRMLQNLLTERFKLVVHHETKVLPVYELVIARNGPNLKESVADGGEPSTGAFENDRDGFPIIPPGQTGVRGWISASGTHHWTGRQATTGDVARLLTGSMASGRKVIDRTGLTGKYDFTLYFGGVEFPGRPQAIEMDDAAPIINAALQKQLGLRLVNAKAPLDILVIDYAEKVPAEN